jgi:CheY-like chemotaxis protein
MLLASTNAVSVATHHHVERDPRPATLLLVDDDEDAVEVLSDALEAEGYLIRIAHDGEGGLASLDEGGYPDMVLLDVEMPVLTGPEMALQMFIRDVGRENIPILLCSGVLNLEGVAAEVGTPYFLGKPYTLEAVLDLVARVLVERQAPTHPRGRR